MSRTSIPTSILGRVSKYNQINNSIQFSLDKTFEELSGDSSTIAHVLLYSQSAKLSFLLDSENKIYEILFEATYKKEKSIPIYNSIKESLFLLSTKSKELSSDWVMSSIFSSDRNEARVVHQTVCRFVRDGSKVTRVDSGEGSVAIKVYIPTSDLSPKKRLNLKRILSSFRK